MVLYTGKTSNPSNLSKVVNTTEKSHVEEYITRITNILGHLLLKKNRDIATTRLSVLKQEIALNKKKA
jgi:hypothetical protein